MRKKIIFCAFLLFGQNFLLFGQQKIMFLTGKIPASKTPVSHLFLAGNFNNWDPGDKAWEFQPGPSGSYRLLKNLPKGIYGFKITKGTWQGVECNAAGKPIQNRILSVKGDTTVNITIAGWQDNYPAAEKKHTASNHVHIINENFEIPQLGRQRRVWIYLPADYQSSKNKYPVIYMHDGQNLFDDYTASFGKWGVDDILDKLPAQKQCIVVGIDHGGSYRLAEYDPFDSKYGSGQGKEYVDFLVKTLKPYIDNHYRTKPDARHTTVAGSSLGGLISMYAALKYPNVFGNAGIFSPAFWIAPEIYDLAQKTRLPAGSAFYFVCGDAESKSMVAEMQKMAAIIRSKNTKQKPPVVIIKGAGHNEKQWNGDFPGFYNWLIAGN